MPGIYGDKQKCRITDLSNHAVTKCTVMDFKEYALSLVRMYNDRCIGDRVHSNLHIGASSVSS